MKINVSRNHMYRKSRIRANTSPSRRIVAADEADDFGGFDDGFDDELDEGMQDTLDDMADNIEDMQDDIEDIQEDDVDIDTDNNIDGHYIAECDRCHGIFISAMIQSDQEVDKITGICPLCDKESDQYLKWIVQAVE